MELPCHKSPVDGGHTLDGVGESRGLAGSRAAAEHGHEVLRIEDLV